MRSVIRVQKRFYEELYLYRMNTKELYTLKMIQKTNAAYLELHTYTSR
jgi:hypothetical protein